MSFEFLIEMAWKSALIAGVAPALYDRDKRLRLPALLPGSFDQA